MNKVEAYKNFVELRNILSTIQSHIQHGWQLTPTLIEKMEKLCDLGQNIEAYAAAYKDIQLINDASDLPRSLLSDIVRMESLSKDVKLSAAYCKKSLYNISILLSEQTTKKNEVGKHQVLPKELDNEERKRLLGIAVEAGYLNNDYSRNEAKKHQVLPKELDNEDGKRLLGIAVEAGYLNNDYSRNEEKLNIAQTALLAEIISEKLKLKYKWVPFQSLWNLKGLAQTRGNSKDKVGTVRGGEEIEKLYK